MQKIEGPIVIVCVIIIISRHHYAVDIEKALTLFAVNNNIASEIQFLIIIICLVELLKLHDAKIEEIEKMHQCEIEEMKSQHAEEIHKLLVSANCII